MNFSQRMTRFIVGLLLGSVLSWYFFSGRGCTGWLPNEQIIGRINSKNIEFSPKALCEQQCFGLDSIQVDSLLKFSKVNLKKSNTNLPEKIYRLEERGDFAEHYIVVAEGLEDVSVLEIGDLKGEKGCECP